MNDNTQRENQGQGRGFFGHSAKHAESGRKGGQARGKTQNQPENNNTGGSSEKRESESYADNI